MTPLLVGAAVTVVLGLAFWEGFLVVDRRTSMRAMLRSLESYEPTDLRERELALPLGQRIIAPLGRRIVGLTLRFLPTGYLERSRAKLIAAGRSAPADLERFRALRVLTVAAVPFIAVVLLWLGPFERGVNAAVFLLLALACLLGPDAALDRATAERQYAIRVTLPDFIDLLTFSVEAGLGVDQALERAAAVVPGPLAEEVNRMVAEVRAGAGRADALRSFERRIGATEVRSFALALIQADTYGAPVGMVLRAQGEELRVKRSQLAQERAQKAPVKLLIPTVFCVMPALFVVVVGPAMIDYLRSAAGP